MKKRELRYFVAWIAIGLAAVFVLKIIEYKSRGMDHSRAAFAARPIENPEIVLGNGPFSLECATITQGSSVHDDGTMSAISSQAVGTMSNAQYTIEVGVVPCLIARTTGTGDANDDGAVNHQDFSSLGGCLAGPLVGYQASNCWRFDLNRDQGVDLEDFGLFQRVFSEP